MSSPRVRSGKFSTYHFPLTSFHCRIQIGSSGLAPPGRNQITLHFQVEFASATRSEANEKWLLENDLWKILTGAVKINV
jgi:hypothetical protein